RTDDVLLHAVADEDDLTGLDAHLLYSGLVNRRVRLAVAKFTRRYGQLQVLAEIAFDHDLVQGLGSHEGVGDAAETKVQASQRSQRFRHAGLWWLDDGRPDADLQDCVRERRERIGWCLDLELAQRGGYEV